SRVRIVHSPRLSFAVVWRAEGLVPDGASASDSVVRAGDGDPATATRWPQQRQQGEFDVNQFVTEWNTWRDSRNSALAKPFGWLSAVGLHWLDQEPTWPEAPGTCPGAVGWATLALGPGRTAGPAAEPFDLMSESQTDATPASTGVTAPSTSAARATSPSVPSDTSTLPTVSDRADQETAPAR